MRSVTCSLILFLACSAMGQSPRPSTSPQPRPSATPSPRSTATPQATATSAPVARPQFRPAVIDAGADSLVNRIDVNALVSKGQKDGAVQFCAVVAPTGETSSAWTYHPMPKSEALKAEVEKRLDGVKFTPPIYQHQPVSVLLFGTVMFTEAKPHLHIFLNQDPRELKEANDFISPQPVIGGDSGFSGPHLPPEIPVAVTGVVEVALRVDANGTLQALRVTGEDPPLLGFRDSAENDLAAAKFIPAFRSGDATESESILSLCYKPVVMEGNEEE